MQLLTIVTVTYNSRQVLPRLLAALPAELSVIVVDNGSRDDTREVAATFPQVRVIESGNIGYGRGANVGLREVTTPYVALINPDVVISGEALAQMVACMEANPAMGIVGANMTGEAGSGLEEVSWVVGALMLMRMEALREVGMFDERIFLFYEETDLCRRFTQAGWKLAVLRSAMAEHEAGTSSPPSLKVLKIKAWHSAWSKCYYYRKHFSAWRALHKAVAKLLTNLLRILRGLVTGDGQWVVKNAYECLGVLAYMAGMDAFKNGVGRLT